MFRVLLLRQIRRLEVSLTEAQSQRDILRAQLASRQYPNEELVYEAKRLRVSRCSCSGERLGVVLGC